MLSSSVCAYFHSPRHLVYTTEALRPTGRCLTDMACTFAFGSRRSRIAVSDAGLSQIQRGNSKMSSLSRRACYKCGNVGHYAEVCSSSERLCYNCKLVSALVRYAVMEVLTACDRQATRYYRTFYPTDAMVR